MIVGSGECRKRNDDRLGSNPLATLSTLRSPLSTLNYSHTPSGVKIKKQKFH
ncbi:MAG: hypothetical protein LBE12_01370 [Planctomycetaceae bacterium]|nr:hypothetical protein [Planctomycetaceae bacterium]